MEQGNMKDFALAGVRFTRPEEEERAKHFLSTGHRNSNKYIEVRRSNGNWTTLNKYKKVG